MGYYWLLYVFGGLLLAYSIVMCLLKKTASRKITVGIRRIYYSVCFVAVIFIYDFLGKDIIKIIGKNKLGISEEIWFFTLALFAGFILDILIISSMSFKEITIGGTKVQIAQDDLVQQMESQVDLTTELTQKIISQYRIVQNLGKYVESIANKIENTTIDILKEYQFLLSDYFSFQKVSEEDDEFELKINVTEVDETVLKNEFKLGTKVLRRLKDYIDTNQTCLLSKGRMQFMFIPYKSVLLDYNTILIIINSRKPLIKVEQCIIINLLQQLDERLVYQFKHKTRLVRKVSGKYCRIDK